MLETERLIIRPLTHGQLVKYLRLDHSLEAELKVTPSTRIISPELAEALEESIMPNTKDISKNYLFSTLWTIILKETNTMVGDLCFVGEPNADGEIQIGYGTHAAFRGHGYMTEAVSAMVAWARQKSKVKSIVASTDKKNIASYSVLIKNNFEKIVETDTHFMWQLKLDKNPNSG